MERRVTPQLVLLMVLLFAVVSTLVAGNDYFQGRSLAVHDRAERIVRNLERIRYYDEALTGSARLAAATGDQSYERRYHRLAPELDIVIAETLKVADSATAERAIDATSDANQALIAIEERSFALGRQGRKREALALLDSDRYRQQKAVYAHGSERAEEVLRSVVRRNSAQVRRYRPLGLGMGILGGLVLLVAGIVVVRLARERERLVLEHVAHTRAEADRRAAEVTYFETQNHFTDILQVTRRESEANVLIKRHLEQTVTGTCVTVTNRNNSDNRLEVMTELPADSPLHVTFAGAEPASCAAVRLGRAHERDPERRSLLECELCGKLTGPSLCTPSLVGGEVIGSVLVERDLPLTDDIRRRVRESVAQAAPVLANLRNLSLAEARAMTDKLTGLANKRSIEDTLKRMAAQSGRSLSPLAAVMLDLDHFKQVNDVHGHDRGDEVLAAVGAAIAGCLRESDFAGRYGGEEFLILLPESDREGALITAERLRSTIARLQAPQEDLAITASLGVAVMPHDAVTGAALLRSADRALYAAKRGGRDRVETALGADPVAG
ncbi:MAG: GGDEF domain-containing protein [Actinomycetota bacterium]|nr:GGDEF domain-containing protein [Actinomycetota bacterium]